jgi:hypothetical protein
MVSGAPPARVPLRIRHQEHEPLHAVRCARREQRRTRTRAPGREKPCPLKPGRVHDGLNVVGGFLKRRHVVNRVRQPHPARVEQHDTSKRAKPAKKLGIARIDPYQIEVRGHARHHDQRRPVAEHLVGKARTVAPEVIRPRGNLHAASIAREEELKGTPARGAPSVQVLALLATDGSERRNCVPSGSRLGRAAGVSTERSLRDSSWTKAVSSSAVRRVNPNGALRSGHRRRPRDCSWLRAISSGLGRWSSRRSDPQHELEPGLLKCVVGGGQAAAARVTKRSPS